MAWEKHELEVLIAQRRFYLNWIADLEAGKDPLTIHRVLGEPVDDRAESLERWRRNVAEIEAILRANGIDPDANSGLVSAPAQITDQGAQSLMLG